MKKVKIVLTIILLSLIIGLISGCSNDERTDSNGKLRIPPWTKREIEQMKQEEEIGHEEKGAPKKLSPIVRYIF